MSAAVHKRRPSLLQSSSFLIPPIRRQNSKGANFSSPEITDREDLIKTLRAISSEIAKAVLLDVQESIDQLSRSLNDKIDTVLAELGSERATTASPASSSNRRVSAADRKHSRILFDQPGSTNDLSGSDLDVASPTNQARIVFGRRNRNIPITEKTASIPHLPGAPQTETSPLPSRRVARGASREHPPRASGSHRTSSSSSRSSSPSERARRQEGRRARASITNFNAEEPRRRGSLDRTQSGGNRGWRNSHDAIEQNDEEVPSSRDRSGRASDSSLAAKTIPEYRECELNPAMMLFLMMGAGVTPVVCSGATPGEAKSAEVGETNAGSESPVAELTHGHLKELLERYQRDGGVVVHLEGRYTAAEVEEKSVARARASTAGANKTSERTSVTKRTGRRAAVNLLALSSKLNLQGLITEEGSERMMTVTEQLTMIATSTATAVRNFFKEPVSPSSSGRIVWDMILAAALVYVIIGIPFEAAFVANEGSYPSSQLVLDAILLIDVLLQFQTQFSENGALISSRKRIARRYLKSWLWPELLTSIPWGLFISKYSRELSAIKLGRTLSLARLGNMTMTIMAKVEYRVQSEIWWIILGVLKLVSALLVMCHWGACLWWLVGKLSIEDHDISWITAMDMVDATRAQQYVAAMYFMTTTLTTVGYGDVTPETHVERLFCIFAEIVAGNGKSRVCKIAKCDVSLCEVFALFSGLLCALMLTYDESGSQYRAKLKDAMRYMNKHKLESSLRIRVRHFLHQLFENQTNLESRRALVEFLRTSESLQRDVYVGLMGKMLKRYSWFKGLSHEILGKVCSVCEDLYYAPTDVMIYASEDADGMYFVVRGSIELGWEPDNSAVTQSGGPLDFLHDARGGTSTEVSSEAGDGRFIRRPVTFRKLASSAHLTSISNLLGAASRMYGDFFTGGSGPGEASFGPIPLGSNPLKEIEGGKGKTKMGAGSYCGQMSLFAPYVWPRTAVCSCFCEVYHIGSAKFKEKMYESEDSKTIYNEKALCVAAREGNLRIVEDLLHNEKVDADCVDEDGLRPLFHAISRKHARIVTALLVAGADADSPFHLAQDDPLSDGLAAVDGQQSVPQHAKRKQVIEPWNFRNALCPLHMAMFTCSLPVVRAVCDHTDFSALPEREVSRIMAYAAMAGYTAVVESALENLAPDGPGSAEARETIVNKLDDTAGYSLVHYASESGQEKLLYSLLLKRADPGKAAADGSMPIHLCARKGYDVCLTQLLEHGADPIATNTLGQTALDIALANNKFDIVNLLKALNIHELAKSGELEAIQNAASQGCNLDRTHPKTGFAPLYYAAERGNIEIMKLLLENGADPNRSEPTTFTALYAAINKGQNEAVKLLLEWQADPNQVVGNVDPAKRSFGTSPLAAAIKKGSSELVDLLLDTGDVALTAEEFKTAFEKKSKPSIKRLMKALSPDFPARYQAIWELRSSNGESLIQHFARKGDVKILEMANEFNANFGERFASVLGGAPLDIQVEEAEAGAGSALSIAALAGKDKAVTWLIEKAKVPVRWESLAKILIQLCRVKIKIVPVVQILIPIYERLAPDFDEANASDDEELVTITDLFAEAVKAPNYQLVKYLLDDHKRGINLKRLLESYGPTIMFRSDSVTSLSNSLGAIEGVALEGGLVVEAVKTKDAKVVKLLVEFLNGGMIKLNEEDQDTWNLTQAIGLAQEQGATETSEWLASHLPRPKEDKSGTSFFTNESNKKSTKRSSLISQFKSTGKEFATSSARGSALFSNNHSSTAQWSERLLMKLGIALLCLLWGMQAEAGGRTLDADFPQFVGYLRDRCGMEKVADPDIDTAILDRLSMEADTTGRDDRPWLLWYTTDGKITPPGRSSSPVANATFFPYWERLGWGMLYGGFDTPQESQERHHKILWITDCGDVVFSQLALWTLLLVHPVNIHRHPVLRLHWRRGVSTALLLPEKVSFSVCTVNGLIPLRLGGMLSDSASMSSSYPWSSGDRSWWRPEALYFLEQTLARLHSSQLETTALMAATALTTRLSLGGFIDPTSGICFMGYLIDLGFGRDGTVRCRNALECLLTELHAAVTDGRIPDCSLLANGNSRSPLIESILTRFSGFTHPDHHLYSCRREGKRIELLFDYITSTERYPREVRRQQMYAMGYLEGLATAEYLWLFYHLNTERIVGPPGERTPGGTWMKDSYFAPILTNFMEGNHNHQECRLEPDYLQLALGYYCQLLGLLDGYNRAVGTNSRAKYTPSTSKSILTFLDILAINADGQLPELQQIGLDHQSLGEIRPHKHDEREVLNSLEKASVPQRCSALVKLVRNSAGLVTDVISAHTTWESFPEMVRVMKEISAPMVKQDRTDATLQFSSYPGCISSTDDWVIRPSMWLVSFETTTNIIQPGQFGTPEFTPDFIRIMIVVSLSHDTESWKNIMETCDLPSGTYNSQWLVVDYQKVKQAADDKSANLLDGSVMVLESAPGAEENEYGVFESRDMSKHVSENGHFAGFNEAMFPTIRRHLGSDSAPYPQDGRYAVFQQLAPMVHDIATMYSVMQFNEPGNRGSIAPLNADDGGADLKITNLATMKEKGGSWAYSGPPRVHGYTADGRARRNEYVEKKMSDFFESPKARLSWEFPLVLFVAQDQRMCMSKRCQPDFMTDPRDLKTIVNNSPSSSISMDAADCAYLCVERE
ncbi:hypothetical protein FOL46_009073 [Perkinsus olseni]|uniref:Cyclic nucleotide-binding domain-containing protein n=1 Tax=Perkinsus olseni TaxID=32597 RepID=A0A7J6MLJ1_PEROL|nr:hypothetical protein FOL46_009073 [Perkinsus olseni]